MTEDGGPLTGDLLADETNPGITSANLGLTLEAYPRWIERVTQPELKQAFLANCSTRIPFYRTLFDGRVRSFDEFPIVERSAHDTRRSDFIDPGLEGPLYELLAIPTNGTLAPSLRVAWDLPSMFDLNHVSYLRFFTVFPGLFSTVVPGEPSVFVLTDLLAEPRTSVVMPGLDGAILRKLILGRDNASDTALIDYMRHTHVALLHGKPSVLSRLVELDRLYGDDGRITPAAIVCSGENLYPDDRARIEGWLGCPVIEAYVASEAGLIAFECGRRTGMHVLGDHLTIEVLASDGTAHPTGTGDLLITNALNWRHAFVRYRIGDQATVTMSTCACGHDGQTIVDLPGRERSTYRVGEVSIPAAEIAATFEASGPLVKQYQVSYAANDRLLITWIPQPTVEPERVEPALSAILRDRFPGTDFDLRSVESINVPGGKLRRFV